MNDERINPNATVIRNNIAYRLAGDYIQSAPTSGFSAANPIDESLWQDDFSETAGEVYAFLLGYSQ